MSFTFKTLSTDSRSTSPSLASIDTERSSSNNPIKQTNWITAPWRFFGKLFSICFDGSNKNKTIIKEHSDNNFVSNVPSFQNQQKKEPENVFLDHTRAITNLVYNRNPNPSHKDEYKDLLETANFYSSSNITNLKTAKTAVDATQRLLNFIEDTKEEHPSLQWREREQEALKKLGEMNAVLTRYHVEERNNQDYKALEKEAISYSCLGDFKPSIKAYEKLIAFIEKAENASPEKPTYPWSERKKEALKTLTTLKKNQEEEELFRKYSSLEERNSTLTELESETSEFEETKNKDQVNEEKKFTPEFLITTKSIIEEQTNENVEHLNDNDLFECRDQAVADFKKGNTMAGKMKRTVNNIIKNVPSPFRSNTPPISSSLDGDERIK